MVEQGAVDRRGRVGLIGFGAIGQAVAGALRANEVDGAALASVLVRDLASYREDAAVCVKAGIVFTDDADVFFAAGFDLLVEAAGQGAVRQYAARGLRAGLDVLVVSIGAFTDDAFYDELAALAAQGRGRLLLAAGALPAVDWMQAAALAPVTGVTITQTKPVASWRATPAADLADLDALVAPACFFEGSAREAAATFAKSSNITAMLALATVGLDATQVHLVADPTATAMQTQIALSGLAGAVTVTWQGVPSEANPSSSADVPLAVIKAIRNWAGNVVMGV